MLGYFLLLYCECMSTGRSRTSSTASMESNKSRGRGRAAAAAATQPTGPITTTSVAIGPDGQSALDTLIAAASSMNPTQFDLPREMVLPINFPGTDRGLLIILSSQIMPFFFL